MYRVLGGPTCRMPMSCYVFFFNDTATTEIYTLSLHDALPIWPDQAAVCAGVSVTSTPSRKVTPRMTLGNWFSPCSLRHVLRSEEHTSELQSRQYLVCRLLLEKKKNTSSSKSHSSHPHSMRRSP